MMDQQYKANLIRSKRIQYIDMAKGIGIMLVLLSHSISMNSFIAWANSFFMPLFFMCSGWCYQGPNTIQKRIKKILVPYYVWGGIGLIIENILAVSTSEIELNIWSKILGLILGTSMWNYPLWFLVAFFVSSYLMDETEKVFSKIQYKVLVICCCFIFGNILGGIGKYYEIYFPFRVDIGLVMVVFIFLAYCTRKCIAYLETLNFYYKLIVAVFCFTIN